MANLKKDVLVEGTNWNVEGVNTNHPSKEHFMNAHLNDKGTYERMLQEKKKATLELVWNQIQENTPKSEVATKVETKV